MFLCRILLANQINLHICEWYKFCVLCHHFFNFSRFFLFFFLFSFSGTLSMLHARMLHGEFVFSFISWRFSPLFRIEWENKKSENCLSFIVSFRSVTIFLECAFPYFAALLHVHQFILRTQLHNTFCTKKHFRCTDLFPAFICYNLHLPETKTKTDHHHTTVLSIELNVTDI